MLYWIIAHYKSIMVMLTVCLTLVVFRLYLTTSPSLIGSETLTVNRGWNGSTGVPGVEGSEGSNEPLLPKSDVGVSCKL